MPAIALGELRAGFLRGGRRERNETMLREFLAIPTNDIWIAATAARAGAIVLSSDDHFTAIARVGSIMLSQG